METIKSSVVGLGGGVVINKRHTEDSWGSVTALCDPAMIHITIHLFKLKECTKKENEP